MKKFFKKMTAVMLVAMLVLGVACAGSISIKDNGDDTTVDHTYTVYQIMTGDVEENTFTNAVWGVNANATTGEAVPTDVLTALAAVIDSTDSEIITAVEAYVNTSSTPYGTITTGGKLENVPTGYYLIVDNGVNGEDTPISTKLIQVVNDDVVIEVKTSLPTVDKKVYDEEDNAYIDETEESEAGGVVKFQLAGTVSSNIADYDVYYYAFNDTLTGLTLTDEQVDGVVVSYKNAGDADETVLNDGYTVVYDSATNTLKVEFDDLTVIDGIGAETTIYVEYEATLDADASASDAAGTYKNTVSVEYSNNPSDSDGNDDSTAETEEDEVEVVTLDLNIVKEDQTGEALENVGFTLYAADGTTVVKAEVLTDADGKIAFDGLDAGEYVLKETTVLDGYEAIDPISLTLNEDGTVTLGANAEGTLEGDTITIVNVFGSSLPSTGGMGTTILYIVGGILVVGAGVTLIVRKRMQNEAE